MYVRLDFLVLSVVVSGVIYLGGYVERVGGVAMGIYNFK